jgi:hypothetical protein
MSMSDNLGSLETVAIYAAPDAVTAEIVRGALEAEGIAAVIGEHVTTSYGSVFATGEGSWGEVRVPAEDVDQARAIVAAHAGDAGEFSDAELDAQAGASYDPGV